MARKTVKVEISLKQPEAFSKLIKDIWTKHAALGNNSPLKNFNKINMPDFNTRRLDADTKRGQAAEFHNKAESINQQAELIYGRAKGQNAETPNTLYNTVTLIRDFLLLQNAGNEESLSEWGFNVVVGAAKGPKKKQK